MRALVLLLLAIGVVPALVGVDARPRAQATRVAPPDVFFGAPMGTDRRLADWPSIERYFTEAAEASDRVALVDAGPTTDGHRLIAAVISAPENIARLDAIKTANRRLADPRTLDEAEARRIAATEPVVVAIGASIHATEIGATQAANDLLFELATARDTKTERLLRDVVLILFPSLNPDGHVLTVDWYRRWVGTPFEGGPMPWLYQKYAGHDINRDAFMLNLAENRSLAHFFYTEWHPQVFLTMHQMGAQGPRFFVPPNYDPIDPNYDPVVWRTAGLLGNAMALALEEKGRAGVVQNAMYDYFWPGYEDSAPLGHNTVCLLTEAASVDIATPVEVPADELRGDARGLPEYRAQMNFPNPWPGGPWTLADIVDYDMTAARGLLDAASKYRGELLFNFYAMGRRAVDAGERGGPFAFVMPPAQFDPSAAHTLRQLLIDGGVEVRRAIEPFTAGGRSYPAGTDLVLMAQPFRAYAKTLLERQEYPARRPAPGAPVERPHDVTGWTLPWQMGVAMTRVDEPFTLPRVTPLDTSTVTPASVGGARNPWYYVIDGRGTGGAVIVNRLQAANASVSWTTEPMSVGGTTYAPGAIVVRNSDAVGPIVESLAVEFGLQAAGIRGAPSNRVVLSRPRVGIYKSWMPSADEGWTRWVLERYEFPYETLTSADIAGGNLAARVDVIVVPDQSPEDILNGHAPGTVPDEYAGGIGDAGVAALAAFVDAGGTLVTFNEASDFAVQALRLPARNVLADVPENEFFCPGSLLGIAADTANPLAYGMPEKTAAFFAFGRAYALAAPVATASNGHAAPVSDPRARIAVRYAPGDPLMSGWLEGAPLIEGQGAVVDVRAGQGRVVLFGIRPQHRGQALATFRLLFNAIHMTRAR